MTSFYQALSLVKAQAKSFGTVTIDFEDSEGRVLAEDIFADKNYPPFNRAAMDGYAIMQSDWEKGIRNYRVLEIIYAGETQRTELVSGCCYKIMTGAATPFPADLLIKKEEATAHGDSVLLSPAVIKPFLNISREGTDTFKGNKLLQSGCPVNAQTIGLLATLGKHKIITEKLPLVAIITTGNELVAANEAAGDNQIRNSNAPVLKCLLKKWAIKPLMCIHSRDSKDELENAVKKARKCDIIIITGGVSAGDADYVPEVLEKQGLKVIFHKAAIKPGKPVLFGNFEEGNMVFGLPGNPLSCLITYLVFVEEFIRTSFGLPEPAMYKLPLLDERVKHSQLTEFFPVALNKEKGGLNILSFKGPGDITASFRACGLGVHPETKETLKAGELISFYPFGSSF